MRLSKIGIVSTFPPTHCGIATYSTDLIEHLKLQFPFLKISQFELVNDSFTDFSRNHNWIRNSYSEEYLKTADYINSSDIDVLDIQHEFKIFGNSDGENISILLDNVRKPIVTTLHTVNKEQSIDRENIFKRVVLRSDLLFVFSKQIKHYLIDKYDLNTKKICVIPHGVPSIPFRLPNEISGRLNYSDDLIFVSSGHMRETKGYEIAIKALAGIQMEWVVFIIISWGQTIPE